MIEILDIISNKMRLNRYIFSLQLLHKWLFRLKFILSEPAARRQEQNDQNEAQGGGKKKRSDGWSKQRAKDIKFVLMQLANKSNEC